MVTTAKRLQRPEGILAPSSTLSAGLTMSRALAVSFPEVDRLDLARMFGVRLVTAWWRALTANDAKPQPLRAPLQAPIFVDLPDSVAALADSIGESAAQLDEPRRVSRQL